jgi:RHS repeat-associated protein
LRFPGQIYDSQAGLQQNYFRDYDPAVGRYVESDPIGLRSGVNTYAYANANPISLTDPLGLRPLTQCEKDLLLPYIPDIDLNNADLHDGKVPWYLPKQYDGITRGNDIYFRPGVYDSTTLSGIAVLGHELVHVGQYREGMTWYGYLWDARHGYDTSKYEPPAYAEQAQIEKDLKAANSSGCEPCKR